MMDEDKIELRSEEFQEMLGAVPSWILRQGIWILAVTIVILLTGSIFFKYPDTITATMKLTGSTPPAKVVARTSGKLSELYISDNQNITAGACIGVIDNPANTKDIFYLKEFLKDIGLNVDTLQNLPTKTLQLGDLQNIYSSFYQILFEYNEYKRTQYLSIKSDIVKSRINQYLKQKTNLQNQRSIVAQKLEIARNKYERDSILTEKGVISKQDLEDTQDQYLQNMLSLENISESIDNVEIQIGQMKESLFDADYTKEDKENTLRTKLRSLITELRTGIQNWELKYLLISPIDGKVSFTDFWTVNQNITADDEIFSIIPISNVKPFGKAYLPVARSGKVKPGQQVNIRFESFPDDEFGMVKGIVSNISLVPTGDKNNYVVEIELPDGLTTTYNKKLPYNPDSQAQADIITEDVSLLERFFMPLRKILTENL